MNKFSQYLTKFFITYLKQQKGCSNNTIQTYRDAFKSFFKFLNSNGIEIKNFDLIDFNKKIVLEFLEEVEKNTSISTRNIRRAAIMSFCNFILFEEPIILENISSILTIPIKKGNKKVVKYLSEEDMKLLLQQPDLTTLKGRKDMIIMSTLFDTGTRITEFINIKLKDVSLEKPYSIRVFGKNSKFRDIPIMGNTCDLLKKYIKENKINNPEQYLFCNSRNERYSRKGISHKIDKYSEMARKLSDTFPEKVHPHMFRHTKAVIMLNSGIDLLIISQFFGHASLDATQIYAKITDKTKREILEKAYFDTTPTDMPDWLVNKDIMSFLENL